MISWQNIYGHEQIKADLQLLLQENKLPHALLFSGIGPFAQGPFLTDVLTTAIAIVNSN